MQQKQLTQQKQTVQQRQSSRVTKGIVTPQQPPIIPPTLLGFGKRPKPFFGRRTKSKFKPQFKYTPTLFSVVGDVKATKKIKLGKIGFTGLENRPILPMMKPFKLTNAKRRKGVKQ